MRRPGANAVRGPASALTSFLREQGIEAGPISAYSRRRVNQAQNEENQGEPDAEVHEEETPGAGPSSAVPSPTPATRTRKRKRAGEYDSDDLDEDEEATSSPSKKKATATEKAKAKAKAKAAAQAKKKARGDGDYEDDDDDDEDEYSALSKSTASKPVAAAKPSIGSFENCANCSKKFTVTRYTPAASPPPGYLCHDCAKASGTDPFKKPAPKQQRKGRQDKRKIVNYEEKDRVDTLAQLCIRVVTKHIEDVEALGDISSHNVDMISKIMAKNRRLTSSIATLFYDVNNTTLALYDCTSLLPDGLCTLASLNPNLTSLRLDYVGRMNDAVLAHWSTHLKSLTHVDLLGPFNIKSSAWINFFRKMHRPLEKFAVTQSPRFDLTCLEALVARSATSLVELRLGEVGQLCDAWLDPIACFTRLTRLNLAYPATSLSDEGLIELLSSIGERLTHLDISGHDEVGDLAFETGIGPHAKKLVELRARDLVLLTDEGIAKFFGADGPSDETSENEKEEAQTRAMVVPPLEVIDLSRAPHLSSNALTALLAHSGSVLRELHINGWKDADNESLLGIGERAPNLTRVDLGWCRAADDWVVKALVEGPAGTRGVLEEVGCFGCNKITTACPRKRGIVLRGIEVGA
ncbi:hypothetical protein BS47DRAFT_1336788 [Hydnum rufescens UP504]|uniref:DNA repair protein rhp7 treble clef domain-containing protein n=1 Tax=Hydnum rufescens UP504 TaxID=1448309 RepID=A0A9P6B8I9_9AGAM|nr:hypothetical protein BS47DRAFT_1336788 [Hydnum rufescens UP504]